MFALTLDRVSRLKYEPKETERVQMKADAMKQPYGEIIEESRVVNVRDGRQKITVGEILCKWQKSLHGRRKNTSMDKKK